MDKSGIGTKEEHLTQPIPSYTSHHLPWLVEGLYRAAPGVGSTCHVSTLPEGLSSHLEVSAHKDQVPHDVRHEGASAA